MISNLFVPGAAKSGTSSLHLYLDDHPNISMSAVKEPHFWIKQNRTAIAWKDYISNFDNNNNNIKVIGESSTGYMVFDEAINNIFNQYGKDPFFIFLLRNPIDRAISHYSWLKGLGFESKPFKQAFLSDYGHIPNPLNTITATGGYKYYYEFGLYGKYIERYLEKFGGNRILVITTDELKNRPMVTLNTCCDFLNIPHFKHVIQLEKNKTIELRYKKLTKFLRYIYYDNLNLINNLKPFIPKKLQDYFIKKINHLSGKSKKVDNSHLLFDRAWLKKYYEDDIKLLKEITNKSYTNWKEF